MVSVDLDAVIAALVHLGCDPRETIAAELQFRADDGGAVSDVVTVSLAETVPVLTAADYAAFMMGEADREHGLYTEAFPDARERWRWLYRVARSNQSEPAWVWPAEPVDAEPESVG
jgi:hypothetical protein